MSVAHGRKLGGTGWNVWRSVIGTFYLGAAVFNLTYTLPGSDGPRFFDGYADGAWFPFLEDFMNDVFVPNAELFMVAVIVFEILVGVLILSRARLVDIGVGASVLWVLVVLPFLAWPYLLTNLVLAVVQALVAVRRYDTALWTLIARRFHEQTT